MQVSTAVFRPVAIVDPEPFFIDVERPMLRSEAPMARRAELAKAKKSAEPPMQAESVADREMAEEEAPEEEAELYVLEAEMRESPAGVQSFDIPGTWTIPSDGSGHPVSLATYGLPSKKRFYWCASDAPPVIAVDRITNGEVVLLAGTAKVYCDGEFIGETRIGRIAPHEEFELGAREELKMKAEKKLESRSAEKADLMKGRRNVIYQYGLQIKSFRDEESEITIAPPRA